MASNKQSISLPTAGGLRQRNVSATSAGTTVGGGPVGRTSSTARHLSQAQAKKKDDSDTTWNMRLMSYIGAAGTAVTEYWKNNRTRPRVYYDRQQDILYVDDEKFGGKAFWRYFDVQHYLRRGAILLLCDPLYIKIVSLLILLHSLSAVLQDPDEERSLDSDVNSTGDTMLVISDRFMLFLFLIDLTIATLAHGVKRMFTSPMKLIDVLVVAVAFLLEVAPIDSKAAVVLYVFNALRPVRLISRLPGAKKLVLIFYSCLPTMASVIVLLICISFVFSMAGVLLFSDVLHQRCLGMDGEYGPVCSHVSSVSFFYAACPSNGTCTDHSPLPDSFVWNNFDNLGYATLGTMQIMTFDDWGNIAETIMNGFSPFALLYFFLLTMIGAFWALNLVLAVITDSFSRFFAEEQVEKEEQERKRAEQALMDGEDQLSPGQFQGPGGVFGTKKKEQPEEQPLPGDERPGVLTSLSLKGTNPLVKQEWKRWVSRLSRASALSMAQGLQDFDVATALHSHRESEEDETRTKKSESAVDEDELELMKQKHVLLKEWHENLSAEPQEIQEGRHGRRYELSQPLLSVPQFRHRDLEAGGGGGGAGREMGSMFEEVSDDDEEEEELEDLDTYLEREVLRREQEEEEEAADAKAKKENAKKGIYESKKLSASNADGKKKKKKAANRVLEPISVHQRQRQFELREEFFKSRPKPNWLLKKLGLAGQEVVVSEDTREHPTTDLFERYEKAFVVDEKEMEKFARIDAKRQTRLTKSKEDVTAFLKDAMEGQREASLEFLKSIFFHPLRERVLQYAVFFNCAMLLTLHHGNPPWLLLCIDIVTGIVDVALVLETGLRMYLLGGKFFRYVTRSTPNFAEFVVAFLAFMDLALVLSKAVPILCVLQIMRLMKYAKKFPLLITLMNLIKSSLYYLLNFFVLLVIFITVFSVMGRHIFAGVPSPVVSCPEFTTGRSCEANENCLWVNKTQWMRGYVLGEPQEWPPPPTATKSISHSLSVSRTANNDSLFLVTQSPLLPNDTTAETAVPKETLAALSPFDAHDSPFMCRQYQGWGEVGAEERFTFLKFIDALMTIFNLIIKDGWSVIMYRFMSNTNPASLIFFYVGCSIGGYVLFSLLIAILLVNFGKEGTNASHEEDDEWEKELKLKRQRELKAKRRRKKAGIFAEDYSDVSSSSDGSSGSKHKGSSIVDIEGKKKEEKKDKKKKKDSKDPSSLAEGGTSEHHDKKSSKKLTPEPESNDTFGESAKSAIHSRSDEEDETRPSLLARLKETRAFAILRRMVILILNISDAKDLKIDLSTLEGRSMFFFAATNPFRLFCCRLISGQYFPFEKVVFLVNMIHCTVSIFNNPKMMEGAELTLSFVFAVDWVLTVVMLVEATTRLIALGGIFGLGSYCNISRLHRIDMIAVVISTLATAFPTGFQPVPWVLSVQFALTSFRPFRMLVRSKAMLNVLSAIYKTVPAMLNTLGLSLVISLMMSVISVQAFHGQMRTCSDGSDRSAAECIGHYIAGVSDEVVMIPANATTRVLERQWHNLNYFHFDNAFNAFMTLLEVTTGSTWSASMWSLTDSSGIEGGAPRRGQRPYVSLFYILWIFIGHVLLLNIFVGTVVDQFMRLKLEMSGSAFLTEEQTEVAHIRKLLHQSRAKKVLSVPDVPFFSRDINVRCHHMQKHIVFVWVMKIAVIVNVLSVASIHYRQSAAWNTIELYENIFSTLVLMFELVVKVLVAGPKAYWAIGSHRLEVVLVAESFLEILVHLAVGSIVEYPWFPLVRLLRVFRLMREQKGFTKLLHTGFRSLPAMTNIGALLIVVFYSFSFIGMSMFHNVRNVDFSQDLLSNQLNFNNFPRAVFALYKVATLDDWGAVSGACGLTVPYCDSSLGDCGNKVAARLFFMIFVISVGFIMVNLFIAVVLENFSESVLLPTYMRERMQDIDFFRKQWAKFDPAGRQIIPASMFVPLLRSLPGPRVRLAMLKGRQSKNDDTGSMCSWTSEEMAEYAAHNCVGLEGEAVASTIPTLRQLNLPVMMPNQEILFVDAIEAIGEKLFHIKLVEERIQAAHQKAKSSAKEYQKHVPFVEYHCATVVQAGWRRYVTARDDPNAEKKISSKWNEVLAPILAQVWAHHAEGVFGTTESAEEAAKYRKMTKTKRTRRPDQQDQQDQDGMFNNLDDTEGDASIGDGSLGATRGGKQQHIKEKLSLADALKAQMAAIDEMEEQKENLDLEHAIEEINTDSDDDIDDFDDFMLTEAAAKAKREEIKRLRRLKHGPIDESSVQFKLPMVYDRGEPVAYQLPSLDEIIRRRRRQLAVELSVVPPSRSSVQDSSGPSGGARKHTPSSARRAKGNSPDQTTTTGSISSPRGNRPSMASAQSPPASAIDPRSNGQQGTDGLSIVEQVARLPHNIKSRIPLSTPYHCTWEPLELPQQAQLISSAEVRQRLYGGSQFVGLQGSASADALAKRARRGVSLLKGGKRAESGSTKGKKPGKSAAVTGSGGRTSFTTGDGKAAGDDTAAATGGLPHLPTSGGDSERGKGFPQGKTPEQQRQTGSGAVAPPRTLGCLEDVIAQRRLLNARRLDQVEFDTPGANSRSRRKPLPATQQAQLTSMTTTLLSSSSSLANRPRGGSRLAESSSAHFVPEPSVSSFLMEGADDLLLPAGRTNSRRRRTQGRPLFADETTPSRPDEERANEEAQLEGWEDSDDEWIQGRLYCPLPDTSSVTGKGTPAPASHPPRRATASHETMSAKLPPPPPPQIDTSRWGLSAVYTGEQQGTMDSLALENISMGASPPEATTAAAASGGRVSFRSDAKPTAGQGQGQGGRTSFANRPRKNALGPEIL